MKNLLAYLNTKLAPLAANPDYGNPKAQETWTNRTATLFFDMPDRTTDSIAFWLQQGEYSIKNRGKNFVVPEAEIEKAIQEVISQIPGLRKRIKNLSLTQSA